MELPEWRWQCRRLVFGAHKLLLPSLAFSCLLLALAIFSSLEESIRRFLGDDG